MLRYNTHLKNEEAGPGYIRNASNSADFYLSVAVKISRTKLKKLFPIVGSSDESITSPRNEPLFVRGFEFSNVGKKPKKLPVSTLPKIEDIYNHKFLTKPQTQNVNKKKSPPKISIVTRKDTLKDIPKVTFKEIPNETFKDSPSSVRRESLTEKPSPRNPSPNKSKIITKVSYKEASRLPEWAMIAKPELEAIWKNIVCMSNGIKPVQHSQQYKYYIGKGNNSSLIKRLMSSRPCWVSTDNIEEANFVWTQWKDKSFISTLPTCKDIIVKSGTLPSIAFQVPVRINNVYRQVDLNDLGFSKVINSHSYTSLLLKEINSSTSRLYNKLEHNQHLANKKGLLKSLKAYYETMGKNVFDYHPITFHVTSGDKDPEFMNFVEAYNKIDKSRKKKKQKNLWIIKPGENSNRGNGIQVSKSLAEIKQILKDNTDPRTSQSRTYILQKYIEKPLLVHNRKFDIRCYSMITCINSVLQAYFYVDGYIRTSSVEYSLNETSNNFIHLTNDAVQKHSENYGKYEDNNKMTYKDLQRYLEYQYPDKKINFFTGILPKIKSIVRDTISAVYGKIDPNKRLNCMEIFGYDFMIDSKLKPWIIEVNTNPCLELSSSYLSYLIPAMVDNALRISLDPLFLCSSFNKNHEPIPENRFDLIFHQLIDGNPVKDTFVSAENDPEISDAEETFPDEGNSP
jgi:Tubulin-tyrosine ligase family